MAKSFRSGGGKDRLANANKLLLHVNRESHGIRSGIFESVESADYVRTLHHATVLSLSSNSASQNDAGNSHSFTAGIYPIHALVDAINLRFKFHFESSRPTNRIDKVCIRRFSEKLFQNVT